MGDTLQEAQKNEKKHMCHDQQNFMIIQQKNIRPQTTATSTELRRRQL